MSVLERGGSDISSTALGHFLQAEGVDIFTDVPGVMTADPKVVPGARPFKELSFGHAHRLSAYGAKVMHPRAFDWAKRSPTPIFVRSIHDAQSHTRIDDRGAAPSGESAFMGIACRTTDRRRHAVITLVGWGAIDGAASAAFVRDGLQRAGLSYADLEVFADAVAVTVRLALVQEAAHFLHSLCLNQQAEGWAFFEHRLEKSAIPSDAFLKLAQS